MFVTVIPSWSVGEEFLVAADQRFADRRTGLRPRRGARRAGNQRDLDRRAGRLGEIADYRTAGYTIGRVALNDPQMSRETMWTLILRDAIRRLRQELERADGPHATRESVIVIRENVARWLDDRAKPV